MKPTKVKLTAFDYEDDPGKEYLRLTFDVPKSDIKDVVFRRCFSLGNDYVVSELEIAMSEIGDDGSCLVQSGPKIMRLTAEEREKLLNGEWKQNVELDAGASDHPGEDLDFMEGLKE